MKLEASCVYVSRCVCICLHLCPCVEPISYKDGGWWSPWQWWDAMFSADKSERSESDVGDVRPVSSDAVHLRQVPARRRLFLPLSSEIQLGPTSRLWTSTSLLECHLYEVCTVHAAIHQNGYSVDKPLTVRNFKLVRENHGKSCFQRKIMVLWFFS